VYPAASQVAGFYYEVPLDAGPGRTASVIPQQASVGACVEWSKELGQLIPLVEKSPRGAPAMIFDEVARLAVQPAVGPPGPRVLAVLALTIAAGLAWTSRAVAHGWTVVTRPRMQVVHVDMPRRRLPSQHEAR